MQFNNALERQIGGNHYKGFAIQPVEYSHFNQLSFLVGCVIKRIARYNQPTGKGQQDLEKALHEIDLLLQLNDEMYDEPNAYLSSAVSLKINPFQFCFANHFNEWQRDIVHRVTLYNRIEGEGTDDLMEAKRTIMRLMQIAYPA